MIMGLLVDDARNDARPRSLTRTRASLSPRGACNLQYTQTNPYWWIARIRTLVLNPFLFPPFFFLRSVPLIETRSHRVSVVDLPLSRSLSFSLKLLTLSGEIAFPLREDVAVIRWNWFINRNQYELITVFIIIILKKQAFATVSCNFSS